MGTGAVNASRTQVTVGYGVGMDSFVHSSEAAIANSTGLQAELPDDQDNLAVVGIDMWNDAENVSSSCTTGDCVFDPITFVQNDGVLNLEIWADEAESDDDEDADMDDADVETAWVGGVISPKNNAPCGSKNNAPRDSPPFCSCCSSCPWRPWCGSQNNSSCSSQNNSPSCSIIASCESRH